MKNEYEFRGDHVVVFFKSGPKEFLISLQDLNKVKEFNNYWTHEIRGKSRTYYVRARVNNKYLSLHRYLLNPSDEQVVDHINGDTLDNRRENIRIVTKAQNAYNKTRLQVNNNSGFQGVFWDKDRNKWRATAQQDKKRITLGRFDNIEEAKKKVIEFWERNGFRDVQTLQDNSIV